MVHYLTFRVLSARLLWVLVKAVHTAGITVVYEQLKLTKITLPWLVQFFGTFSIVDRLNEYMSPVFYRNNVVYYIADNNEMVMAYR